jgi:enterochelin esterase-like enzyme
MKRTALLFFFGVLLICNPVAASGLRIMESTVMHSRVLNMNVHFSVCLPKDYYDTKKSYPVVYLLHGLGDDETSWLEYGQISQYADKSVESDETVPMIFVMPEAFRTYYVNDYNGSFLYQDMFVNELVPYIDSLFRTKADRQHRALMGYSMGGFGALNLHLKHPDVFGSAVPLSISVRTDGQYSTEDASGWDDQWGRLFGEPGFKGRDRITEYYKENSPFYILSQMSSVEIKKLNIYIDNGDKEQTLCRSNEELHILMRKLDIPHEFRVRDGGHSFQYWCSALPNSLRFISDAFEGKPYRGDKMLKSNPSPVAEKQLRTLFVGKNQITVFVPLEYNNTNRKYPVIYCIGTFAAKQKQSIASVVNHEIEKNNVCPILLVFLPGKDTAALNAVITLVEEQIRVQKGYKFRAIAGFENGAKTAFQIGMNEKQFGFCILSDGFIDKESITDIMSTTTKGNLKLTSCFIDAPDKGSFYEGNGNIHMLLRDKDVQHEYRVRQGNGGFEWVLSGLPEIITFTAKRFHK